MSKSIDINFQASADCFRTWIFAEDLSLSLKSSGLGFLPMAEADAVKTHLHIRKIKTRELRRCIALIKQLLEKHHMTDEATVSEGSSEP
jgi:hypothetical protein